jgi:translation initiation factor 2 alpha subunit (eIF-2alpha)
MRWFSHLVVCGLAVALLTTAGCRKQASLNIEKSVPLDVGDIKTTMVDAPIRDQDVSVTVTSTGAPVNVYVVAEKDQEAAEKGLLNHTKPMNLLAGKEKTTQDTLQFKAAARTGFAVILTPEGKNAEVKLKITGK